MKMAIAQSLEDSRFDADLRDLDERDLQLGLEQSVTFDEALAVNRVRQRLVLCERERMDQKTLREKEEEDCTRMCHRKLVYEFKTEEQTDAEAMAAGQEMSRPSHQHRRAGRERMCVPWPPHSGMVWRLLT